MGGEGGSGRLLGGKVHGRVPLITRAQAKITLDGADTSDERNAIIMNEHSKTE